MQKLYLMQRILSSSMVLIKVLNSKGLKHSPCKTPLSTISNNSNIIIIITIIIITAVINLRDKSCDSNKFDVLILNLLHVFMSHSRFNNATLQF